MVSVELIPGAVNVCVAPQLTFSNPASLGPKGIAYLMAVFKNRTIKPKQEMIDAQMPKASIVYKIILIILILVAFYKLWLFIAYSAGTGGSMIIIGSAAGVAAMGMEKIDFIWYFKHITWLAFLGFLAGGLTFLGIYPFL
jgi:hypothetical protein